MKKRDLIKLLTLAGFKLMRKGEHDIYRKDGFQPIPVPRHREINELTAKNIMILAGIIPDPSEKANNEGAKQ